MSRLPCCSRLIVSTPLPAAWTLALAETFRSQHCHTRSALPRRPTENLFFWSTQHIRPDRPESAFLHRLCVPCFRALSCLSIMDCFAVLLQASRYCSVVQGFASVLMAAWDFSEYQVEDHPLRHSRQLEVLLPVRPTVVKPRGQLTSAYLCGRHLHPLLHSFTSFDLI